MALKYATNNALSNTTALPSAVPTDNLILISTQTASNSANISFTGINGTYDMYEFKFINIQPRTDGDNFEFNFSTDSGSNYNVTKTTTFFESYHNESDSDAGLQYQTGYDLAQSTSFQKLSLLVGGASDENACGTLQLFNPSSTTYVKHFISTFNNSSYNDYNLNDCMAGYCNTTSAVNAVRFKCQIGNFDGTIKMYGVKKS